MDKRSILNLLFETGLRHLYKAENGIFESLALMTENVRSSELKRSLQHHRDETYSQIERLRQIFSLLSIDIHSSKIQGIESLGDQSKELLKTLMDWNFTDKSKGLDGILSEGKEIMRHFKDTEANDIALIGAQGMVENFEIGCYRSLCTLAGKLGSDRIVQLLNASLKEEIAMEEKMRDLAKKEMDALCECPK